MTQDFQVPETIHQVLKIVFIGDANVGKTSLLKRFQRNSFEKTNNRSTIGVEFCKKLLRFPDDNLCIQLHLWDTAGQERYKSITKQHYRGAAGIVLVYDLMSPSSLESISAWLDEIHENTNNDCFMALIGNKKDCFQSSSHDISNVKAKKFAEDNRLYYYETSAMYDRDSPNGIETIMLDFVYEIIKGLPEDEAYNDGCDEVMEEDEETLEDITEERKISDKENFNMAKKPIILPSDKKSVERRISFGSARVSRDKKASMVRVSLEKPVMCCRKTEDSSCSC